ncbi:hypothetical protein INT45_008297 [Circinella minor]|uniref:BD-FAE-like domain-containing protein n=1 Tax=Circinella minor TaxID=1195481 RepID=A0A8H7S5U2_9FUNG|nr:hypothetical protein INT45_008297 [Circinella minor]
MSNNIQITHHYYTNEKAQFKELDLYIPLNNNTISKSPLLVFIHGGAWRSEDKADHVPLAQQLVAHGFPVALINYRLSLYEEDNKDKKLPPKVQHPMHIQDAKEAIDFLIQYGEKEACFNASKIYLIGHSAGAHIAMMLTLDPEYNCCETNQKVLGVIGAQGIYDIDLLSQDYPDYDFVPQAFGPDRSKYSIASPVTKKPMTKKIPAMLLVHSLDDTLINVGQANAMVNHLKDIANEKNDIKNNIIIELDKTSVKGDHYEMLYSKEFVDTIIHFVQKTQ